MCVCQQIVNVLQTNSKSPKKKILDSNKTSVINFKMIIKNTQQLKKNTITLTSLSTKLHRFFLVHHRATTTKIIKKFPLNRTWQMLIYLLIDIHIQKKKKIFVVSFTYSNFFFHFKRFLFLELNDRKNTHLKLFSTIINQFW